MLLTYIDEIGKPGLYVSVQHKSYNTSPAFGYAGFITPADKAREFGAYFAWIRNRIFRSESMQHKDLDISEKKGSEFFRSYFIDKYPQNIRGFFPLINRLQESNGCIFYYVDDKPLEISTKLISECHSLGQILYPPEAGR